MATSVVQDRDKYSELFLLVTKWAALLLPLLVAAYGVLMIFELMPRSPAFSMGMLLITCLGFLTIGVVQFIHKTTVPRQIALYLVTYHILGCAYLFWGAGFNGPLTLCWAILLIISDMLFSRRAIIASGLLLLCTALFTYAFEPMPSLQLAFSYLAYIAIIISVSVIINKLRGVQQVEHGELKRTREQEELQRGQLLTLINSVGEAIVSTSSTGTVRIYNAALLSLLDTNQGLSGAKIDDIFHLYNEAGEPVSLFELVKKSGKLIERDDLSHRFPDGESIRLDLSCAPIKGNFAHSRRSNDGFIFIARDVSRAKSLEQERNEFISVVSHELRTPITIAEGTISNLQFLLERGSDPKQLAPSLKEAHEQIIYLASMVNDLSTLSRAERGVADKPESVNVGELLNELYHRYEKRATSKHLILNLDVGPRLGSVLTSRLYLEEVLQNFLTNSLKYTQQGTITLSAKRLKSGIAFAVRDTGIGISKADQKHLFEKFYRAEDYRIRETAGTGLGLYVVQKLSQKLGIRIEIESRLNHGSTFSFVLPDTPTDTAPKHSDPIKLDTP